MKFVEELPYGRKAPNHQTLAKLNELRERPGQWAIWAERPMATNERYWRSRYGREGFEFVVRAGTVYARYVGEGS